MTPTLYQKWALTNYLFFVKNLNILCSLNHTFLFKFHQHVANAYKWMYGETLFMMFWWGILCSIADANIESLGLSIHSLTSICTFTTRWCVNKNRIIQTIQNFWAFWQKERLTIFWQSIGAILEDVYAPEKNCLMQDY